MENKSAEFAGDANTLYLGFVSGKNYGWGIAGTYLNNELSKLVPTYIFSESVSRDDEVRYPGKVVQPLTNESLKPYFAARGKQNYGYVFFESELTDESLRNASELDMVIAGSGWALDKLRAKGIKNSALLLQGVDGSRFYPIETKSHPDRFVIFSGGKFEFRKGQDLVLAAFRILQEKYRDIYLLNCWHSDFAAVTANMSCSPHIKVEIKGRSWQEVMSHIYNINGIDGTRIETLPIVPNEKLREIYARTDIGVFPNRCEAGTNLVLMEYMACARPVIVSNSTGHCDMVNENNAILLNSMRECVISNEDSTPYAVWEEVSVEELAAMIEFAYLHRNKLLPFALNAATDMEKFTWKASAERLLKIIGMKASG